MLVGMDIEQVVSIFHTNMSTLALEAAASRRLRRDTTTGHDPVPLRLELTDEERHPAPVVLRVA